jgi:GntR family transcriptional regulator
MGKQRGNAAAFMEQEIGHAGDASQTKPPPAQPLYAQVTAMLTRRLAEGKWSPGMLLPTEPELALELGVSPGTVRRAMALLERRRLIERRRGRGTVVTQQTTARSLFHFFRVVDASGRKLEPTSSVVLQQEIGPAGPEERERLQLEEDAPVHRLARLRALEGRAAILEHLCLPAALFPQFSLPIQRALQDEFYVLYQKRFGITVTHAAERLSAVAAGSLEAELLALAPGTPLQRVDRIAIDLQDRPVEWRISLLDTRRYFYAVELD